MRINFKFNSNMNGKYVGVSASKIATHAYMCACINFHVNVCMHVYYGGLLCVGVYEID